ncbi:MAG: isocitrate lyase/phosphoenolpyruvate mutase family protein [Actinomycetota bacterium]|nr:isocitrate lyase/phosphoenolpyruvate mutase family protein [Actinomycetota bacterium]
MTDLAAKAEALRALHHGSAPLVLPNAWDVVSARMYEEAGFPAIATTSGGVAAVLGYPDGEVIPFAEMFEAVARIARAVSIPVTADLEAGYGLDPDGFISLVVDAGVVGFNHEDTDHSSGRMRDAGEQAANIAAYKEAGRAHGMDVVLNARVDVYLRRAGEDAQMLVEEATARARAYRDAGADSVFPIFCSDENSIAAIVDGARTPVNILAHKAAPSIARLAELGVARITFGSGLMRDAAAHATQTAAGLLHGRYPWR